MQVNEIAWNTTGGLFFLTTGYGQLLSSLLMFNAF